MEIRQDLTLSSLRVDPLTDNADPDVFALEVEGPTSFTKRVKCTSGLQLARVNVTGTVSLTAAQSGSKFIVGPAAAGLAADTVVTLPTAEDGLYYEFEYVGGAADAEDLQINTGSDTNYFIGGIVQHDTDDGGDDTVVYHPDLNSNSIVNLLTPDAGTWVKVFCDGTNWFLTGCLVSATNTGVTWADQ